MLSWLPITSDSDFTLYNIPFGIFKAQGSDARVATRVGDKVVDLYELELAGLLTVKGLKAEALHSKSLNEFISLGKSVTSQVRNRIQELFKLDNNEITSHPKLIKELLYDIKEVELMMPVEIGDYTDFYSSLHHATNVGSMFRPDNPLMPNWKHLPVAYHGRASSIKLSGTPVKRPKGQIKINHSDTPILSATQMLDFEVEMAYVIGKETNLGESIEVDKAEQYIFGFVLFNDWSARDIQSWEYQPLGPFLSKNFLSSISPWVVTIEALEPFKVDVPKPDVELLPYLKSNNGTLKNFDVQIEVGLESIETPIQTIVKTNYKYMYWNHCQQLAHHTINGCNVRVGDMIASGTISGPAREERGCLLELTMRGKDPIMISNGGIRKFLENGDNVVMKAYSKKGDIRIGFGEVRGKVVE